MESASKGFFKEAEVFWQPDSDIKNIYEQLASKRYREIPRHQIRLHIFEYILLKNYYMHCMTIFVISTMPILFFFFLSASKVYLFIILLFCILISQVITIVIKIILV